MKKLICIGIGIGLLAWIGCGKTDTPENVAKNYLKKKFEGIKCDLSGLNYKMIEQGDDAATVVIDGAITYTESVKLVKVDGNWILACDAKKETVNSKSAEIKASPKKGAAH